MFQVEKFWLYLWQEKIHTQGEGEWKREREKGWVFVIKSINSTWKIENQTKFVHGDCQFVCGHSPSNLSYTKFEELCYAPVYRRFKPIVIGILKL